MIFAIDFDGTFAADVATFKQIVAALQAAGHTCIVVTNRAPDNNAAVDEAIAGLVPVLYADGKAKRWAAYSAGYVVDVWIDDNPVLVDFGGAGLKMIKKPKAKPAPPGY